MEQLTKCHCHTRKRPLAQIVEWKSESQFKHSARGVGASSSLSVTTTTGIVARSSIRIRSLEDFPAEVIANILLRLPVKSLMCCRCVCKNWCNIIDSPSFTNTHFTSRTADNTEEPQLMLVSHASKMRLFSFMDDGSKVLRLSEFPIAEIANSHDYYVESLCYGLFCFRNFRHTGRVFLINPLRGEVLILPPATVTPQVVDFYGVGFDCTTETYKVVRVFSRKSDFDSDIPQHDLATEVYTLGTRSWREIPTVPPGYVCESAVSAYGDVHWIGHRWFPDGSGESMIMSFDARKEEFKLTPYPNLNTKLYKPYHLLYLRGHLAMVDKSSTTHLEVWVLKDYEKGEWALEYRISAELMFEEQNLNMEIRTSRLEYVIGLGSWEHGLLFHQRRNKLFYYDPKTEGVKFMCIPPHIVPECDKRIFGYIGSLVSLKNSGNMVVQEASLRNYFDLGICYGFLGVKN